MDENKIRKKLEENLESQELDYSLDLEVDNDYVIISVMYQDESFLTLGGELDEIFEADDYMIERGELDPEPDFPGYKSRTFTLKPIEDE